MAHPHQSGFTLVEVVVAFAIFALSVGALYESFRGAMQRTEQARERELEWLTAESLLSELRVRPTPWQNELTGVSKIGMRWRIVVSPDGPVEPDAFWQAFRVAVHVRSARSSSRAVEIDSVELARVRP